MASEDGSMPTKFPEFEELDAEWLSLFRAYTLDGMYKRGILDEKTRELCAIASLTVLDRQPILGNHIQGALRKGATKREVLEVILQTTVYGGFPAALSALHTLRRVTAHDPAGQAH